jgi:hypothetical protein
MSPETAQSASKEVTLGLHRVRMTKQNRSKTVNAGGKSPDLEYSDVLEVFPLHQKHLSRTIQELNLESLSLT